MRRVAYLVLLLILTGKPGFGQIDDFAWSDFSQAGNRNNGKLIGTKYIYTIYGNANFFYHADWYPGTLTTSEGEKYSDCSLRYDAINDALVAFNPRVKAFFVVDKYLISSFSVEVPGGKAQRFIKLAMEESGRADHFYEILYEGNVSLLSHNRIIERTTTVYKNMFGELDNRKYDLEKQLYIKLSDKEYRRISPGRQSIMNLFPEQKKEIRRLLRNNRINDYTWEEMPRIVEMLDGANFF